MHKLADIVTCLARNYYVGERIIQCDICILDLLNNIIIEINESYVCKYLLDLDLNSDEYLEGQLVHEERIQSTAMDKISTVTFQNLTFI